MSAPAETMPIKSPTPPPLDQNASHAEVPAFEPPHIVIEPRAHWTLSDLDELWRFRELFYYLTLRDLKVRYKQTILGVGWSVFQPLVTMLVFIVFFGRMGKLSEGVPDYTLFVLSAIIAWTFFSNSVANAANSLLGNERLVTRTYFPRILLPGSAVGAAFFDFLVGMLVVSIWLIVAGVGLSWNLLMAPVCVLMLGLTAFGFGSMLSALIANFRDFRYVMSFGMQLWMFCTPCLYLPESAVGPRAQQWLPLNPAYGLTMNFRASLLDEPLNWYAFAVSSVVGLIVLVAGLSYFRRMENTLADTI